MKDSKQLYIFAAKCIALYLVWLLIEYLFFATNSPVNQVITYNIAALSSVVLGMLGYNAEPRVVQNMYNMIYVDGLPAVSIEDGCNGVVLMVLFAGFVIAYPGPVAKKLWYIPAGLVVIYFLNIIRCVALVLIFKNSSIESFDFNHKYTFTTTLYAIIFGMWMLWANKFAKVNEDEDGSDTLTAGSPASAV
ncbi:MAG: archaeosortase/exosortase family protein [Bacteroidota bacterium]